MEYAPRHQVREGQSESQYGPPRRYKKRGGKRRRRKSVVSLSHDGLVHRTALVGQADPVGPETEADKVLSLSLSNPWACAPSLAWVLMYLVLIAMVAVSLRFHSDQFKLFA